VAKEAARWKRMSLIDDNSLKPPEDNSGAESTERSASGPQELRELPLSGDPISYVAVNSAAAHPPSLKLPEDLRINWSWVHLVVFTLFAFVSLAVVQVGFAVYYLPANQHFANKHEFEQFVFSKPFFAIGSMVVWEASLLFFLYVTIALLPSVPFWRTLGWRNLPSRDPRVARKPWPYLLLGCALSIAVFLVNAKTKAPENAPIEELFKHRTTMFLFMAMAVLFAPLVEETLFRGYLYPLLARLSSSIAASLGVESSAAVRQGVGTSIVLTGIIFGLVHGYQLGWSVSLVLTLIAVGIIFTYVRARSGTVYASYLLHLGYNSTIAIATLIGFVATKGFTQMPPHP
jgi:membrane protease YdiL (CAAX protease family)